MISRTRIDRLWLAADQDGVLEPPHPRGQRLLGWRRGFSVYHRVITGDEARALALLERSVTFGTLCAALDHGHPTSEVAGRALAVLKPWLADELLARPLTCSAT